MGNGKEEPQKVWLDTLSYNFNRLGAALMAARIRILVVDDYEPWRRFVLSGLQAQPDLRIVGEALDGVTAIEKAEELRPDLVLLDIVMPKLNGFAAAPKIFEVSPESRILFASTERSPEVIREAFRVGAQGYLLKSDAVHDLLAAVRAVVRGNRFFSCSLNFQPV